MIGHEILGTGPEKVLVFHGWSADHTSFAAVRPVLDTEKFTFAFLDYRGCGLSKDQLGQYTIEEIGRDALELVDHLKWERFHIVGHSMGGMALQWVAANQPDRVKSGVAIAPMPACGVPTIDPAMEKWFYGMADNPADLVKFYMYETGSRYDVAWAKTRAKHSFSIWAHDAYEKYAVAFIKTNFAAKVVGLSIPLKVLVGEYDPAITVDVVKNTILKWFPNSELEVLKLCGHVPNIEVPLYLGTTMQAFLSAHA
jgi:3-oxoadipate enol-lactonase